MIKSVFVKIVNFLQNYTDVIICKQNNVYVNEALGFEFMCSLLTRIYSELVVVQSM